MWRKGNSHALLVGMQIGAATVKNNMEFPQKVKNRATIWSIISTPGCLFEEKTLVLKDMCIPMFIVALFIVA